MYIIVQIKISVVDKPCNEEENLSLSLSNLIKPCVYTPYDKLRETKIVIIQLHEKKMLNLPYSSVDKILVNTGVVNIVMPFWRNAHIRNHKDAFIGTGKLSYFFSNLIIFKDLPKIIIHCPPAHIYLEIFQGNTSATFDFH